MCDLKLSMLFHFVRAHLDSLLKYIADGTQEGAKLVYGGKRLPQPGTPATF